MERKEGNPDDACREETLFRVSSNALKFRTRGNRGKGASERERRPLCILVPKAPRAASCLRLFPFREQREDDARAEREEKRDKGIFFVSECEWEVNGGRDSSWCFGDLSERRM